MSIAYVEHPITQEEKEKYRKDFDQVIDVKFKPAKLADGDKVFEKSKPKAKASK
tara:strand:- start:115 stop:276 length:162 start_codon:yes stop_codon:yes gene_type:complete